MSSGSQAWAERHAGGTWGGERGDGQLEYIGVFKSWEVVTNWSAVLYTDIVCLSRCASSLMEDGSDSRMVQIHLWWMISSGYCRLSKESNVKSLKVRSDGKVVAGIAHDWYCLYQPTVGLWKKRSKNLRLRSLKQWETMTINSNFQEFFGAQLIWNLNGFLLWKGSAFGGIQQFCEKIRSIKPSQQFNT